MRSSLLLVAAVVCAFCACASASSLFRRKAVESFSFGEAPLTRSFDTLVAVGGSGGGSGGGGGGSGGGGGDNGPFALPRTGVCLSAAFNTSSTTLLANCQDPGSAVGSVFGGSNQTRAAWSAVAATVCPVSACLSAITTIMATSSYAACFSVNTLEVLNLLHYGCAVDSSSHDYCLATIGDAVSGSCSEYTTKAGCGKSSFCSWRNTPSKAAYDFRFEVDSGNGNNHNGGSNGGNNGGSNGGNGCGMSCQSEETPYVLMLKCMNYTVSAACGAESGCNWNGTDCVAVECYNFNSQDSCGSQSGCNWTYSCNGGSGNGGSGNGNGGSGNGGGNGNGGSSGASAPNGYCVFDPTLYQSNLCSSSCWTSMTSSSNAFLPVSVAEFNSLYCGSTRGACLPVIAGFIAGLGAKALDAAHFSASICSSSTLYNCFVNYQNLAFSAGVASAQKQFLSSGGNLHSDAGYQFNSTIRQLQLAKVQTQHICDRGVKGDLCLSLPSTMSTQTCLDATVNASSCSSTCNSQATTFFTQTAGCCVGSLAAFYGPAPALDTTLIPSPTATPSDSIGISPVTFSGQYNFSQFSNCASLSSTWTTTLATTCTAAASFSGLNAHCASAAFPTWLYSSISSCGDALGINIIGEVFSYSSNGLNASFLQSTLSSFCSSDCAANFAQLDTYRSCIVSESEGFSLLTVSALQSACVQVPLSTGTVPCGSLLLNIAQTMSCSSYTDEDSCGSAQCQWFSVWTDGDGVNTLQSSYCDVSTKASVLATVCPTCLQPILELVGAMSNEPRLVAWPTLYCSTYQGANCYSMAAPLALQVTGKGVVGNLSGILCNNATELSCFRVYAGALSVYQLTGVQADFQQCVSRNGNPQTCVDAAYSQYLFATRMTALSNAMCYKNANNDYCVQLFPTLSAGVTCLDTSTTPCLTNSSCSTTIANALTSLGCCAATIQGVFGEGNVVMTASELYTTAFNVSHYLHTPLAAQGNTSMSTYVPTTTHFLHNLECDGSLNTTLNADVVYSCSRPRSTNSVASSLRLPISFQALQANVALYDSVLNALIKDIAAALGLTVADILDAILKADTSATITTSHRVEASLATANPTIFAFTIQAENNAATTAASSTLTALVQSNTLSLPAAAAVVSAQCSSCLANGATSLSASTGSGSGVYSPTSAASATSIAGFVCALLVLLFLS